MDGRRRELERSTDPQDRARVLRERMRLGQLSQDAVEMLAVAGHEPARFLCVELGLPDPLAPQEPQGGYIQSTPQHPIGFYGQLEALFGNLCSGTGEGSTHSALCRHGEPWGWLAVTKVVLAWASQIQDGHAGPAAAAMQRGLIALRARVLDPTDDEARQDVNRASDQINAARSMFVGVGRQRQPRVLGLGAEAVLHALHWGRYSATASGPLRGRTGADHLPAFVTAACKILKVRRMNQLMEGAILRHVNGQPP